MNIRDYKISCKDKLGMSTASFYPMPLELAFDIICRKLDYKVCEMFINTKSETEHKFLREIKRKADDNGTRIVSVHPYFSGYESTLFFSEYSRRIYDGIDLYRQFFDAAAFLGAKYIIFHGLRSAVKNFPTEQYVENFLMLADAAKKYNGVEVLQENIADNYPASAAFIRDMQRVAESGGKKIKFTLDFKHATIAGQSIPEMIDVMGSNLAHIHFNDMDMRRQSVEGISRSSCKLPFFGNLDYDIIFNKLLCINYIGDYITEVYRNNYEDETQMTESKNKFYLFCGS